MAWTKLLGTGIAMTDWDLETLGDFDGTFFNNGAGWNILFQIQHALSMRFRLYTPTPTTSPSIGDLATQLRGIVWTYDTATDGPINVRERLELYYSFVVDLLSGHEGLRWTEAEGRTPEWTLSSLSADIGMGDFADLLIKPQSPEPIVWLIEAIKRLKYPKLRNELAVSAEGAFEQKSAQAGPPFNLAAYQAAWDGLDSTPWSYPIAAYSGPITLSWAMLRPITVIYAQEIRSVNHVLALRVSGPGSRRLAGKCKAIDYLFNTSILYYTGPDLYVTVGTSDSTNVGHGYGSGIIEESGLDFSLSSDKEVSIRIDTERPSAVPFTYGFAFGYRDAYIDVTFKYIWLYCTMPEIMGAGEVYGVPPSVSGTNIP